MAIVRMTTPAFESQFDTFSRKVSTLSKPVPAKESVGSKVTKIKLRNL